MFSKVSRIEGLLGFAFGVLGRQVGSIVDAVDGFSGQRMLLEGGGVNGLLDLEDFPGVVIRHYLVSVNGHHEKRLVIVSGQPPVLACFFAQLSRRATARLRTKRSGCDSFASRQK